MHFKKKPKTQFKDIGKISRKEARREIEALREGIEYHDYLYYVKNRPVISDATYDKLFRRLQELEDRFPEFQSRTSPTQKIGAQPVSELKKVKHAAPMLSLNAAMEEKEVRDFDRFVNRNTNNHKPVYVLEPKFDGFSVEVVYEKGEFKYGATRGDGETGEDISENVKTIRAVPVKLRKTEDAPSFMSVRGEVFMTMKGFRQLNKERIQKREDPFANPRNAAAGIMRQLDPKMVADKPLDIVFYEMISVKGRTPSSHWEVLRKFPEWGLKTDEHIRKTTSVKDIRSYHQKMSKKREELDYEIDGIVMKLDDYKLRDKLGTRQRSPRWALAWKFEPRAEISRVEDIAVQVGRTGMLTPVALLKPMDVGGVTVSRATLHNRDEVRKKDIRIRDKVRVARAGDVIPEVVERIAEKGKKRGREFDMPDKCPACGSKVYREGAYYFCTSELSCPAQVAGNIIHYASREAMDIRELGEKTVKQLVGKDMVKNIADLYRLSIDDIKTLEGYSDKSAKKLHQAIQSSKRVRLDRFLYALGIRHVGRHVAMVIARKFQSLDSLRKADLNELRETGEVGPEIAESVKHFFSQKENIKIIEELLKEGLQVEDMPGGKEGKLPLEGKTFVFTGSLEKYKRTEAKRLIESLGARAAGSVSGETDFVVAGDNPGSKLDEAKKRKVKIINERQFDKLVKK